jgi:hypothetical protein
MIQKIEIKTDDIPVVTQDYVAAEDHMAKSRETGRGYLTGPGIYQLPVDYAIVNGLAIHEGCIELGTVEAVEAEAERIRAERFQQQTVVAVGASGVTRDADAPSQPDLVQLGIGLPTTSSFLWTDGIVPYTIAADVPNPDRVADAVRHIEEMTAIRFVRRTNSNAQRYPNYVEIISNGNEGWSSSAIGMRGGRQVLRFSDRHSWPILVHEFLHALGVYHEQSRSDRDNFVEIRWSNIQDDAIGNFQKKPDAVDYFDYDYGSIMHYPRTSFAKDSSQPTIVPLQSGVTIGQRNGLSYGDRQTIAKMYERFFDRGYAGVWRSGTGRYALWVNVEWSSFRDKWQEWSNQGLRLHDIHVQQHGGRTLYSGVFLPGSGAYGLWANVEWESFRDKWQEWSNQGLRLVDLHVHRAGNQNRYSGVFLPGTGAYALWSNVEWESFRDKWQEWSNQGLRLVDLHVHRVGNQTRYSGVFLPGTGGYGLWANATWSSFISKWQQWSSQGLRLVDLNLHQVGDSIRYSGVFLPGTDGYYLWANVTFEGFRAKWQELAEQGLRLIDFEITNPEAGASDAADLDLATPPEQSLPAEIEAFGGMAGDERSSAEVTTPPRSPEDGGGGIKTANGATASSAALPETETNGGAYFPTLDIELSGDQQGLGGMFLDGASFDRPSAETEGYGGVVLPNLLDR